MKPDNDYHIRAVQVLKVGAYISKLVEGSHGIPPEISMKI